MPSYNRVRSETTRYFTPPGTADWNSSNSETNWVTGMVSVFPIQFSAGNIIEGLAVFKHNTTQRSVTVRLGIYNSANGIPTTLINEFGTVDCRVSTGGFKAAGTGSATLVRNTLYWVACKIDDLTGTATGSMLQWNASPTHTDFSYGSPMGMDSADFSTTSNSHAPKWAIYSTGHGTGALPSDLTSATWTRNDRTTEHPVVFWTGLLDGEPAEGGRDHWAWAETASDQDGWAS